MLTGCPSTTPFGFALGPPNPGWISLPQEPLGIRWPRFSLSSRYSFRQSHFSAVHLAFRLGFGPLRTLSYHTRTQAPVSPQLRRRA